MTIDRQEYLSDRNRFIAGEERQAAEFSRSLLQLSSAALAFSLALVQILGTEDPVWKGWLVCSWISFATSMLVNLYSVFVSQYAYRRAWKMIDEEYNNGYGEDDPWESDDFKGEGLKIDSLNRISFGLVLIGVVSLIMFSIKNL